MTRRRRQFRFVVLLALSLVAVWTSAFEARQQSPPRPIVVLLSLDGWRWDYLERFHPPALTALAKRGVLSQGLIPVFPAKTFPNHYTLVTGLYPDRHGIVSNTMRDPALPGEFSLSNVNVQQDTRWWGGTPLWVTAEEQGQLAGTMFWPGADVEIAGHRPAHWRRYDGSVDDASRVDQILAWLGLPEPQRPTFFTLYFSEVDSAGHDFGPESPRMAEAIAHLDAAVGRLVQGIAEASLAAVVNLVLVSDHGMAQNSRERTILLDDFVNPATLDIVEASPILAVAPRAGSVEAIYQALHGKHRALQIYRSEDLPAKYRLSGHARVPPIVGIADDGWLITTRASLARDPDGPGGSHGYDSVHQSMHGLFLAAGPAFRSGVMVPAFESVHVYELLCRVLGVRPLPNDGDPKVTAGFLR